MNTLLNKAYEIEEEAAALIADAQTQGKAELSRMRSREEEVLQDVRSKAETRAAAIVQEGKSAAKDEISRLKQESDQSVSMATSAAQQNRPDTLTLAKHLFEQDYLS